MRAMPARITRDDVAHVATLARLALDEDELERFTGQLAKVLQHAADVEALELDDVPPTSHPYPLANVLRPDLPGPTLERAEVLAAAPSTEDRQFKVPTILGESP
ncbi:MAG: aspartyl/glutamyl-tRNA(Asn/Gln) amidotransferase subunit [Acidimicrobiales bacterium]|nr:aspartyl/glutamyl-tRNA(Asn/Gln) amidotransferase subunit [Acidimicrobiales bacterium]